MRDDGWTQNEGVCPVPVGTLVDVVFRNGRVQCNARALCKGYIDEFWAEDWTLDGVGADIVLWRLSN